MATSTDGGVISDMSASVVTVDIDELIQAKENQQSVLQAKENQQSAVQETKEMEEKAPSVRFVVNNNNNNNNIDNDQHHQQQEKEAALPSAVASLAAAEGEDSLDAPTVHASNAFHVNDKNDDDDHDDPDICLGIEEVPGDEEDNLLGRRSTQPHQNGSGNNNNAQEGPPPDHERRALVHPAELDYGSDNYDDVRDEGMDDSHIRLKKRLSLMERMQSKFMLPADETKERLLPQDTFSIMIIAESWSVPSIAAVCIFTLQVAIFILVLLDLADAGEPGNVFDVPANVPAQLRATQFIAILVAVLTQGDLRTASILGRDGFTKDFDTAFMDTAPWKYWSSIVARSISGSIGLMVSFVLIITAPSVVELLLNFTAIEFVSSIDELCFYLSRQGFLGSHCKSYATTIANTSYRVSPESRMGFIRRSWKTLSLLIILVVFLAAWGVIVSNQISGKYLCDTLYLQMGDDFVAALGTFNGLYDQHNFVNGRVTYVERRSQELAPLGKGIIEYCEEGEAWTFRWEETDTPTDKQSVTDGCKDWVAKSSSTKTYDVTDTMESPWFVRDGTNREVVLDPFRLSCFDCDSGEGDDEGDFCGGKGVCSNAQCDCEEGWYGLQCEFPMPCSRLAIDARTEPFASTRDWASDFSTITLEDGSLVEAYYRPVYVNKSANSDAYDVVMFTGRRWALTSSEFLPEGGKISDNGLREIDEDFEGTGDEIGNFFRYVYHGYRGYFKENSVAFLSDSMDAKTDRDANSPVGFQWFRAVAEKRIGEKENQKPSQEVDSLFLCRVCDDGSNPCLYDGVCVEGTCQCSLDSFGSLCEVPPVQNGHCDPYFNTPEFKMDGGDCCESTCISTEQYVCGAEDQGYVNTGYFSCEQPKDEWQEYPLNGEAGSYAGFSLALSLKSVAVGELLQDRVRIYDKVGSSWELRDTIIAETPDSFFGTRVALSAGPYNIVSNPSFLAPLTLVIQDGRRTLWIYRCNLDGCLFKQQIPNVFDFHLSDDGTVLATTVFAQELWPPHLIRVYETLNGANGDFQEFQARANVNVAVPTATYAVFTMTQNFDGTNLVLHKQRLEVDPVLGGLISRGETFVVYAWNGTTYNIESELDYKVGFNSYAYEFSLAMSQDGSVLAYGVQTCLDRDLHVFDKGENNTWVARSTIALNETVCTDTERPARNNNLALSRDGSMVAFRLGNDVSVLKWESEEWKRAGEDFPTTPHYPVGLSSDGRELAIGSPEEGIGGITGVYSLPGTKSCPNGTKPLRISLTLDRLPDDLNWELKNNHTGEVLYQQGPYERDYAFGTIVEETCVDADSHCFEFSIYNKRNRGLQAPGRYAIFLDGDDVGRGTFGNLFEKITFGNCASPCPDGMELLRMIMLTCAPLDWEVFWLIDEETANFTVLNRDALPGTDPTVYGDCGIQNGKICEPDFVPPEPVRVEYSTCVDPKECYGVRLTSWNKQVSYVELELGGNKTTTDTNQMCAGFFAAVGSPDKCPIVDLEELDNP